ncbi:MAG: DUF4129 domain-containing protein [Deltaproteobacteria bacterium]|nr:DUF4129 domain-containing protein [Deltaproteobacteria bacterium]
MSRKTQRTEGMGALEVIEEATHLLRNIEAKMLLTYYMGSIPFVLGFLYFWADMSRSPFAVERNVKSAFIIALLFIWMKCWQTVFSRQLWSVVCGDGGEGWTFSRVCAMITEQTFIQPTGFIVLPIALLITLPFGWCYAFYQSITLLGCGKGGGMKNLYRSGFRHGSYFSKQNHVALLILSFFWGFVFFNLVTLLYLAPHMINTFFGIETVFSRAGWTILNTTFLAVTWSITYLIVDPLIKSIYVLRSFYGESLRTGADLKSDLKRITSTGKGLAAFLVILIVGLNTGMETRAMADDTPSRQRVVSAGELTHSIDEIIEKHEYRWRMPRVKQKKEESEGFFLSFLKGSVETIIDWFKPVKGWIEKVFKWIEEILKRFEPKAGHNKESKERTMTVHYLMYALLCVVSSMLAIIGWRRFKQFKLPEPVKAGMARSKAPDLASEDISADELPANSWLEMGRKLMAEGNHRFALRAFYLASLSHLSAQNKLSVASFKSNREYENELKRRAHALPDLVSAFSLNMMTFEKIWYGMHEITADLVRGFEENQERIMAYHEK